MTVLLPFSLNAFYFFFLVWLLWLEISIICWIELERVGIFILFLILEEILSTFHHWVWCFCGIVIYNFYYVEVGSLYAHFLETFYHKYVLSFIKRFFCFYWDDHMVFIIQFVNVVYHTDWFENIEKSLHPGTNPIWSWCMILLMYCWIQFASVLLRIFCVYVHQWYWPVIFFFCGTFVWFWYQGDGGLRERTILYDIAYI